MDTQALLATLRYWRECGIDRLSGEGFGFSRLDTPSQPVPIQRVASKTALPPPLPSLDRLLSTPVDPVARTPLLETLASEVASCERCRLALTRNRTVVGSGSFDPPVVFVGDTPKEEEEKAQEPFVGEARELLNGMLRAARLQRQGVFITNIIKCRPPGDRQPHSDELSQCQGYLFRQLEILRPRVIFAMGKVAIDCLLGQNSPVGTARGKVHSWRGVPVIASYHPAFCLRTPTSKRAVWEDLILMMKTLEHASQPPQAD
ncbi:MAG: uracil-DNA glycosylase [Magnetococcales bacterium]|nr:uracil-DNA glycosylase [Magnetococcales bacterium]